MEVPTCAQVKSSPAVMAVARRASVVGEHSPASHESPVQHVVHACPPRPHRIAVCAPASTQLAPLRQPVQHSPAMQSPPVHGSSSASAALQLGPLVSQRSHAPHGVPPQLHCISDMHPSQSLSNASAQSSGAAPQVHRTSKGSSGRQHVTSSESTTTIGLGGAGPKKSTTVQPLAWNAHPSPNAVAANP
jgi:hypothetical protein